MEQPLIQFALPLLILSGLVGFALGMVIELRRAWARPTQISLRFFQDLLAYDFYIERVYELTVVWAVSIAARFTSWLDRYVVDGFINLLGFAAVFSGQALKYSVSGQSQFYILTILLSVALLFMTTIIWTTRGVF
jgi:NAD(P)H-quinone oxidoreductase subunit 5